VNRFGFFHELNLAVSEYGPDVDDDVLRDALLRIYDHPDFRPGMDELISFLPTRTNRLSAEGLRDIARTFPRTQDEGARPNRVAVVTLSQLGQGLSRLYGAYADREGQVTLEVFASLAEAAAWLDRSHGRVPGATMAAAVKVLTTTIGEIDD
jgi:hypothetical protein